MTEIRPMMGLISYYRKFIANFNDMVKSLTHLLKNTPFNSRPLCQVSIDAIKIALTTSPVLISPDPNEPCILFKDASKHGWSGALTQERLLHVKKRLKIIYAYYIF